MNEMRYDQLDKLHEEENEQRQECRGRLDALLVAADIDPDEVSDLVDELIEDIGFFWDPCDGVGAWLLDYVEEDFPSLVEKELRHAKDL